jgi:hypothetical protein
MHSLRHLSVLLLLTLAACGGAGRSASKASDGPFSDRNALEPSECTCILLQQAPPDEDFFRRLKFGETPMPLS